MIIRVTKKHINEGWLGFPDSCMVALAIKERVKPNVTIKVEYETVTLCYRKQKQFVFHWNKRMENIISDWDWPDNGIKPFRFSLPIPQNLLK